MLFLLPVEVGATPTHLGIMLSETCLTMQQANISSNCPTYEEILAVFEDTTDHAISGGFDYNEFGLLERQKPNVKNQLAFYQHEEGVILWIDPPPELSLRGNKRIIVAPDNFQYKELNQVLTNSSILINENRYVSSTCTYSIISADNWLFYTGDTMRLMLNDCDPEYTYYNETKRYKWEAVQHDITTSHKWKLEKWVQDVRERCKLVKCNYDNTIRTPYDNIEENKKLPNHFHLEFKETLTFSDNSDNTANYTEVTPCQKDPRSLLCEYWKYKNAEHKPNQSSYLKFRNAVAGAIGE